MSLSLPIVVVSAGSAVVEVEVVAVEAAPGAVGAMLPAWGAEAEAADDEFEVVAPVPLPRGLVIATVEVDLAVM